MKELEITVTVKIGPNRKFATIEDLLSVLDEDWSIISHDNPFHERDRLRRRLTEEQPNSLENETRLNNILTTN